MIENTNQFIYLVSITACILMGITFFSFPTPKVAMLQHYKLSKKILGLSYLTLGGLMLFNVLIGSPHKPEQFLAFPSIIISSSQAYVFTFTLLILINPGLGTRRYMWRQLCPILAIITLFIVCNMIWGNPDTHSIKAFVTQIYHPAVAVRFLFFLFYIFQLVYYTYLFRREKRKFIGKMYDYYSDDTVLRLRWVEYAFYAALGIGILAFHRRNCRTSRFCRHHTFLPPIQDNQRMYNESLKKSTINEQLIIYHEKQSYKKITIPTSK